MMVEVRFGEDSFVIDVNSKFESALLGKLPFNTVLNTWKEEIYFETDVDLETSGLDGCLRVEAGGVYYWPPEKGLCIFYGLSQPYSPVYPVGSYIGVLKRLRDVEDGVEAAVQAHRPAEAYGAILSRLGSLGFKASTPIYGGEEVVEAAGVVEGRRVAFRLYVEEYGIHMEGEPLFPHDYSPLTLRFVAELTALLSGGKYVRLDLDEEGWVTVTGFVERLEELDKAVGELSEAYCKIMRKSSRRRIRPL